MQERLYVLIAEISKLHFLITRDKLEELGLYPGQPALLFSLLKKDGQVQRAVAKNLNISPATMNVTIKRMEKNGLVYRKQDENDKRVSRVFICEEGKNICKRLKGVHESIEGEYLNNLSEEEKIIAKRILLQVKENLLQSCLEKNIIVNRCIENKNE